MRHWIALVMVFAWLIGAITGAGMILLFVGNSYIGFSLTAGGAVLYTTLRKVALS